MGVINDAPANFDILFYWFMAGIDHDASEPLVDAFLAKFKRVAVVEMDRYRNGREADRRFDEFLQIDRVGIRAGAPRDLEHDRRLFFLARLNDGLQQLQIVDVKRAKGIFALQRFSKQLLSMCQRHRIGFSLRQSSFSSPASFRYRVARLMPSRIAARSLSPLACCKARLRWACSCSRMNVLRGTSEASESAAGEEESGCWSRKG